LKSHYKKTNTMGKRLLIAAFAAVCIMSCSTDTNDTQTITIDENIPEIADLVGFVPATEFDETSQGKYVGIFGHHLDQDLHGKIYINAGNDTRYTALIELVNGEQLKFTGVQQSRSNPDLIYFEGKSGSFDIDFRNYSNPEATNVIMETADTEAYITLAKATAGGDPFVILGSYVETGNEAAFFGNWDLIGNPLTLTSTPFSTIISGLSVSGNGITQEIVTMSVSHAGSMTPFISNTADDFDTNTAVACAPSGLVIPTTEPVIIDLIVTLPFPLGDVADAISAGGQTSMINGLEATWSLNHTSEINNPIGDNIAETYITNDCNPSASGTWSWNGRTGTTTVL
jgi:hypothetical protein